MEPKQAARKTIKIKMQTNEIKNRKTRKTINENKNCFFEKIPKIDNPLVIVTKEKMREHKNYK